MFEPMTFTDTDELRAYLKTIKTYDQFWDAKEPSFTDVYAKYVFDDMIAKGADPADMLLSLKVAEVQEFVVNFEARQPHKLN